MDNIRVSPRHLGQMRSATFCPHCYWYSIAVGFRHPFDMPMPGIMHNMDRFEKRLVEAHFQAQRVAPRWLARLECTAPVEFPAKMTQEFPEYGLTLVGMPDAVFSKEDGTLCLVDYKTARERGDDDPFLPCYETQLLGYTHLLEYYGVGTVDSAALVYFDNRLADYVDKPLDLITTYGLRVPFAVKIHKVKIDRDGLEPLMENFRTYADMAAPPKGLDGCKNCARLKCLLDLEYVRRNTDKSVKNIDRSSLKFLLGRLDEGRRQARVTESQGWETYLTDAIPVDADCVPAVWDL
jgi:hypothetical protein